MSPHRLRQELSPRQRQSSCMHTLIYISTARTVPGYHVHVYNSTVGQQGPTGWMFRDPSWQVAPGAGQMAPTGLPFQLQVAQTSDGAQLSSVTNVDGVKLTLGLAQPHSGGSVASQTVGDITLFPALASPLTDVAVRSTVAGLGVRFVLHSAADQGPFTLTLKAQTPGRAMGKPSAPSASPGPASGANPTAVSSPVATGEMGGAAVMWHQDASGAIMATYPVTSCGSIGCLPATQQGAYVIETPLIHDSSADPVAQGVSGPVTMTLGAATARSRQLTLALDRAWLSDPARKFPVQVDLPVLTADAADQTGEFGTVSSCAPSLHAAASDVVVGTQGVCRYHGLVSFRLPPLGAATTIQAATLELYTPDQTGLTGVQALGDAVQGTVQTSRQQGLAASPRPTLSSLHAARHGGDVAATPTVVPAPSPPPTTVDQGDQKPSWDTPTWQTAPAVQTDAGGVAQSGSTGHWQHWDVTSLVRQWTITQRWQASLTLIKAGAPVLFATPLGSRSHNPALAPHLNITYSRSSGSRGVRVVGALPVGPVPYALLMDNATARIFVLHRREERRSDTTISGQVSMLDARSGAVLHSATVGLGPLAGVVDEQCGRVFVISTGPISPSGYYQGPGSISMLDAASGAVLRTVPLPCAPTAIVLAQRAGRLFVSCQVNPVGEGPVIVLDATTGALPRTLPISAVGRVLHIFPADEQHGRVYIAASQGQPSPTTYHAVADVLDAASGALLSTIRLSAYAMLLAVDAQAGRLFVSDYMARTVSLYSATTGALVRTTRVWPAEAGDITADPGSGRVFVTYGANSQSGGRIAVAALSATTGALVWLAPLPPDNGPVLPPGPLPRVVLAHHLGRLLTAGVVLDTGTGAVVGHVAHLIGQPRLASVDEANGNLYVTDLQYDHVHVVDARTGALLTTVPVGHSPYGLAVAPRTGLVFVTALYSDTITLLAPVLSRFSASAVVTSAATAALGRPELRA